MEVQKSTQAVFCGGCFLFVTVAMLVIASSRSRSRDYSVVSRHFCPDFRDDVGATACPALRFEELLFDFRQQGMVGVIECSHDIDYKFGQASAVQTVVLAGIDEVNNELYTHDLVVLHVCDGPPVSGEQFLCLVNLDGIEAILKHHRLVYIPALIGTRG